MGRINLAVEDNLNSGNVLVKASNAQAAPAHTPAFDIAEIEDWTDSYFFRPLGMLLARGAAKLRMTPTQLTVLGAFVGVLGGGFLFDKRFGLFAFALLMVHGIIDSADGQLARRTGQVTELGRVSDGVAGYATHAAIYITIVAGVLHRGGSEVILMWAALAALGNSAQAQLYEYHRYLYKTVVAEGRAPHNEPAQIASPMMRRLYRGYLRIQHLLGGLHPAVEKFLIARSTASVLRNEDRAHYRSCFRRPVQGWNLLGDNTRFYAIGVLAWLHRLDLFFAFILVPMNLALLALWIWQRRADRRFLQGV